jgi:hypothetical protein
MMEEAPKIERVVASQGISLSDTAKILTSYLSKVNHHNHLGITSKDDTNLDNDDGDYTNNKSPIRKSKQEREEDALIAQMDQLANSKSSGMISDDIYERLKQITQSITAEVEGRTISACGLDKNKDSDDNVNDTPDDGVVNDFQAGQSENHTKQQQEVQVQQQQQTDTSTPKSHREKKKAKKDKKAAKKAKKEAKRKAKEMEEDETITTDIPLHRKKKIY